MAAENVPSTPADWVLRVRRLKAKNDITGAMKACEEGLENHPHSMDLLYTFGELGINCYNRQKKPDLLKKALISFERLLKINPHHYMANLLAAQIYFKGKVFKRAAERVGAILKTTPNDPRAVQLNQAVERSRKKEEEKRAAAHNAEKAEAEETVESVAVGDTEKIETEKLEGLTEAAEEDYEKLIEKLSQFSRLAGLVSIHLVDPNGVAIKNMVKTGDGRENISSIAADIFRASGLCSRKIGLGNFQRGYLQTNDAGIVLVNLFYAILALVLEPDADMGPVEKRIDRYIGDII